MNQTIIEPKSREELRAEFEAATKCIDTEVVYQVMRGLPLHADEAKGPYLALHRA